MVVDQPSKKPDSLERGFPAGWAAGLGSVSTGSPQLVGLMRILHEEHPQQVQKRPGR